MNVLITGASAPISADLAKVLHGAGHSVFMADSGRWPVGRFSPYVSAFIRTPAPAHDFVAFARCIWTALAQHAIDRIIPTSEEVFWLAQDAPIAARLFAPDFATLERLHNKATFARLAQDIGAGPAYVTELQAPEDVDAIPAALIDQGLVAKPVYSRFGLSVKIRPTRDELFALDYSRPWVVQSFVSGTEVCVYAVAQAGQVRLLQAYLPAYRSGAGASIYFEPIHDARVSAFASAFVQAHNLTGQISFDVMLTDQGLVALECNPRGTSGVHLASQFPDELVAALLGEAQGAAPTLYPAPRFLGIPFLLFHGRGLLNNAALRAAWRRAADATKAAQLPLLAGLAATLELILRAKRSGVTMEAASTLDFEWNGQT